MRDFKKIVTQIISLVFILSISLIPMACSVDDASEPGSVEPPPIGPKTPTKYDLQIYPPADTGKKIQIIEAFEPLKNISRQENFDVVLDEEVTVKGSVLDSGGKGKAASISAYLAGRLQVASTETESDGSYKINLAPGKYFLIAEPFSGDYPPFFKKEVELKDGEPIDDINFYLGSGVKISGKLTGPRIEPLGGVKVYAYDKQLGLSSSESVTTGDGALSGLFEINMVPGVYDLKFKSTEALFPTVEFKGITISDDIEDFNLQFKLSPAERVEGKVLDPLENEQADVPITAVRLFDSNRGNSDMVAAPAGFTSTVSYRTTTSTSNEGEFSFILPHGKYQIYVETSQDSDFSSFVYPSLTKTLNVDPNYDDDEEIEIVLKRKTEIFGIVYGYRNPAPIPSVNVFFNSSISLVGLTHTNSTSTDSVGQWGLTLDAEPVSYQIKLEPPYGSDYSISYLDNQLTRDLIDSVPLDFTLYKGAVFSGTVLDSISQGIPNVTIRAVERGSERIWGAAISDKNGNYRLVLPR